MIVKYEEYFKAWLEGIYDEISYWKELLSGKRKESERLTIAIDPNKRFTLEEELPCNKEKI